MTEFDLALQELEAQGGKIHWFWNEVVVPGPHDLVILESIHSENLFRLARSSAAQVAVLHHDSMDSSAVLQTWHGLIDWAWPLSKLRVWRNTHASRWAALMSVKGAVGEASPTGGPALLLDRDGVLNVDHGYVGKASDVQLLPGIVPLLQRFQAVQWPRWVITNQSGIARGFYSEQDFQAVMARIAQLLQEHGLTLTGEEHSFFHPTAQESRHRWGRQFRKPRPGMIHRARERAGLALPRSVFIGDRATDLMASWLAGVGHCYLLRSKSEGAAEWDIFAQWRDRLLGQGTIPSFEPEVRWVQDLSEVNVPRQ